MKKIVTPYESSAESKKGQVKDMFDNIAPKYDLLNRALSMGIDVSWRRKAVKLLEPYQPKRILDLATGTADFAIEARKLSPEKIIGVDIAPQMLQVGREKISKMDLDSLIELQDGDAEDLAFEDGYFDAITIGFGVRNFEDLGKGLSEIHRVLRPGGAVAILEPAFPTKFPLKQAFQFHFNVLTPIIGKWLSGDGSAYEYLPNSVKAFPTGKEFVQICQKAGYSEAKFIPLTFGICALYLLER